MKTPLRLALVTLILTACSLPTALGVPSPLVLVTPAPDSSFTPTPFQPAVASETPTLSASFTPEPPTNTPPPTFEFTATSLVSPTAPSTSRM